MSEHPTKVWEKTACNRYRIISKEGIAKFGCIYNVCPQECTITKDVHIYTCTATSPIMKSESSQKNQQKICATGDSVCIIGEYDLCDGIEVLLYRDGDPVYKRKWNDIKDRLTNIQSDIRCLPVLSYGYYKKDDLCFMVRLHEGGRADVWISERWWRKKSGFETCVEEDPLNITDYESTGLDMFNF